MKSITVDLESLQTVAAAILNADGVLLDANAGFRRLLPVPAQAIGNRVGRYFIQPPLSALLAAAGDAGGDGYRGLLTIGDYEGKTYTLRGRFWRTAVDWRVLAEYDIADLERLNEAMLDLNRESTIAQHALSQANVALKQHDVKLTEQSLTDPLTGIGNRRRLDQTLAAEVARVQRHHTPLSAIMADIDHFKQVNDRWGHDAGDQVLKHFAALLKAHTRPTDIVARFGGEEFVLLLPNASLEQAAAKAEEIRAALAAEIIAPLEQPVTSSFGAAQLGADEDGSSLLRRIDQALYQAKNGGRNQVVRASPALA